MDYLAKAGLSRDARVLDVGCGWGLAGIFCAKRFQASVTGVDADPDVFPFLQLHAQVNGVKIHTLRREFNRVSTEALRGFDLLIGADVCFWDELVRPLKNLVLRALRAGVRGALIADPGRPPFQAVGEHFVTSRKGEILEWEVNQPRSIRGQILRVGGAPRLS
jgi:predicted nicotinamide N-methyase